MKPSDFIIKIKLPLFVHAKKKCMINVNAFRNWHWSLKALVKKTYQQSIMSQIPRKQHKGKVSLIFFMHQPDKRKRDRANILNLHEKFACDALVQGGFLEDDNDNFIISTAYYTGELDKENPRVDLYICEAQ